METNKREKSQTCDTAAARALVTDTVGCCCHAFLRFLRGASTILTRVANFSGGIVPSTLNVTQRRDIVYSNRVIIMSKLLVGGAEPSVQKLNEPFPSGCQTWYIFWGRRVQICTVSRAVNVKNITVGHRPRKWIDDA